MAMNCLHRNPAARLTLGICWASLIFGIGSVQAGVPESVSDFAKIAEGGFTRTIDGSFFVDPFKKRGYPSLVDNWLGQTINTYAWSGATKNGDLYVGTNIDAACIGSGGANCNLSADSGAQIWKYKPSWLSRWGDWGLSGEWKLVYQSPAAVPAWLLSLAESLGIDFGGDLLPEGFDLANLPRDLGYRNMSLCRAKDGVERIYVAQAGVPGLILYQDWSWRGETFKPASTRGLNASLLEFINGGDLDIGYRGLACFKGRVIAAPAGQLTDPDIPTTPTVLMNDNPTNPLSRWETILNVAEDPDIGNPSHLGVFQIEVVGNNIWVSIGNRTDGFALVKGDGSDCVEPWVGDGRCNITWTTLIADGGGRPGDALTKYVNQNRDFVAGSGATLGVFGNDLYVGPSESGFFAYSNSELMRVREAHTSEPKWELLIGWPRKDWARPTSEEGQAPENFYCPEESKGDMANASSELTLSERALWAVVAAVTRGADLIALDSDTNPDDCFPTTGAGPGYGTSWDANDPNPASTTLPYMIGPYQYFWRFARFVSPLNPPQFYVGTLDDIFGVIPSIVGSAQSNFDVAVNYLTPGFDLLRTKDGETFEAVTRDGFGSGLGGADYGVRTLLQVPKLGLAVGTANFSGNLGTDIYIGTRSPSKVPPYADAGPDQFVRDDNPQSPSTVVAVLNAGASRSSFDGGTPVSCDWFEGDSTVGCDGDLSTLVQQPEFCDDDVEVELDTIDGDNRSPEYAFTVKVTDERGLYACDTTLITASSNQSPIARLEDDGTADIFVPDLPFEQTSGTNSTDSLDASQQDQGGDGEESYVVTGTCDDPDSPLLYVCEFVPLDVGNTVSNQTLNCGDVTTLPAVPPCTVTATITTLTAAKIDEVFGSGPSRPDMALVVEDENQRTRVRWESETVAAAP